MTSSSKLIIKISLALIIATSLPYLYGWLIKPEGTAFMGNGAWNSHDNFVYYAYISQAKNGHWLNWDAFTPEPSAPFFNWFWLTIGLSARVLGLDPIIAFHLFRLMLIPVFVWTIYRFAAFFYHNDLKVSRLTRWAIILIFFSGGLRAFLGFLPSRFFLIDDISAEAYALWSAFASPHFIASWILLIWSVYFFLRGWEANKIRLLAWGGFFGLALCQFHPFFLALLVPLAIIFSLWRWPKDHWRGLWRAMFYLSFLLPVVVYQFWLLKIDPVTNYRLFESKMLTPASLITFLAYGLLFPIALAAIWRMFKNIKIAPWRPVQQFVIVWALTVPFLLYAPLTFQRRLIEAWQLPVVLLATPLLTQVADWIVKKIKFIGKTYCYALAILLFFISPIQIWWLTFSIYHQPAGRNFYFPQNTLAALKWLKQYDSSSSTVLSSVYTGQVAAFAADKNVFIGHNLETVKIKEKLKQWQWFIAENDVDSDEIKKEFLKHWKIDYFFWGENEKSYGDYQPAEKKYLEKIYDKNEVEIYRVL